MVQKFTQWNLSRWVTQDTVNMRTVYGFKLHRLTWTWITSYLLNFDGNSKHRTDVMWPDYVFLLGSTCQNSMTFISVISTFWCTYISERHPEFQSFFINLWRNAMTTRLMITAKLSLCDCFVTKVWQASSYIRCSCSSSTKNTRVYR